MRDEMQPGSIDRQACLDRNNDPHTVGAPRTSNIVVPYGNSVDLYRLPFVLGERPFFLSTLEV